MPQKKSLSEKDKKSTVLLNRKLWVRAWFWDFWRGRACDKNQKRKTSTKKFKKVIKRWWQPIKRALISEKATTWSFENVHPLILKTLPLKKVNSIKNQKPFYLLTAPPYLLSRSKILTFTPTPTFQKIAPNPNPQTDTLAIDNQHNKFFILTLQSTPTPSSQSPTSTHKPIRAVVHCSFLWFLTF